MKILDKLRAFSPTVPGLVIDIVSGGAGLFMPGYGKSAAKSLSQGDWEGAFGSAGYNYLGVDMYGSNNNIGTMWNRAKGLKVAIWGKIAKTLLSELV